MRALTIIAGVLLACLLVAVVAHLSFNDPVLAWMSTVNFSCCAVIVGLALWMDRKK